jgi:hypothetical protein
MTGERKNKDVGRDKARIFRATWNARARADLRIRTTIQPQRTQRGAAATEANETGP